MSLKLGRKPARHTLRTMRSALVVAGALDTLGPPPAASNDYTIAVKVPFGMYLNDQIGDCVAADSAHALMIRTANASSIVVPTDDDVLKLYSAVGGYVPGDAATDQGCEESAMCAYMESAGFLGHKADAIGSVVPTNLDHIKWAIQLFGTCRIGLNLPQSAMDQFNNGEPWSVSGDGTIIGGHDVPCLAGETQIALLSGENVPIKDLPVGHPIWVYSIDERSRIVPGLARSLGCTGRNRHVLKITLDNGSSFKCTPEHLVMLRDGSFCAADKLTCGVSVMPLKRSLSKHGYEICFNPQSGRNTLTHRLVASDMFGDIRGWTIHHVDFKKRNNSPDNLAKMSWEDHTVLHNETILENGLGEYAKSVEGREKSRETMSSLWNDPEWRERALKRVGENGRKGMLRRIADGTWDAQLQDQYEARRNNGLANAKNLRPPTPEEAEQRIRAYNARVEADPVLREERNQRAKTAVARMHEANRSNLTEAQIAARRLNMQKLCYNRWHYNKYSSFEEYLSETNHKVVKIEDGGTHDVYDISVEKHHNFALSCGTFVHNCVKYALDKLYCVTWGYLQPMTPEFLWRYCEESHVELFSDWVRSQGTAPSGFDLADLESKLKALN